ncbi:MAG: alpha/beta fold hydrolase [Actinomycetia bacterium]|nr:alpha/beta fold hydrolase [Actinomycetes bacterium]
MTTPEPPARSRPRRRRRAVITLVVVGAVVLALGATVAFGQRALVYYPDRTDPGPIAGRVPGGTDVAFTTEDGLTLHAWLIAPTTAPDKHIACLFLPGNGGNRALRVSAAKALADRGYTTLLVDYRGYGGNPGRPSETGLARDARAAATYLREHGFAASRTLYVGESLGTSVAVRLATTDPPAGVLLRSPFTSLVDMAKVLYPWLPGRLVRDRFETLTYLPAVHVPVTVLAGSADSLVPEPQSATVAHRAPQLHAYVVVPGADHNDALWVGPYLADQVDDLARAVVPG